MAHTHRLRALQAHVAAAEGAPAVRHLSVAADVNKPDGQTVVPAERAAIDAFLADTPLRKLPGIGRVAERVLREVLHATSCAELRGSGMPPAAPCQP